MTVRYNSTKKEDIMDKNKGGNYGKNPNVPQKGASTPQQGAGSQKAGFGTSNTGVPGKSNIPAGKPNIGGKHDIPASKKGVEDLEKKQRESWKAENKGGFGSSTKTDTNLGADVGKKTPEKKDKDISKGTAFPKKDEEEEDVM